MKDHINTGDNMITDITNQTFSVYNKTTNKFDEYNYILKTIRGGGRKVKGCFVAVGCKEKKEFSIGFSLCHPLDKYDKKFALNLALARAVKPASRGFDALPFSLKDSFQYFENRASKYYKDFKYRKTLMVVDKKRFL